MRNKIVVFYFLVFTTISFGQVSTVTPLSSQGLGDMSFYGDAYFTGFGGSTVALIDSSQANFFNPSSYAYIAQGLPIFSVGLIHQESMFEQDELSSNARFSGITHMSLAIPLGKRFGLGFGLKPFSRVGYEINNAELVLGDSIFYEYTGKGEIQEFNVGFSIKLVNSLNHRLAIGANGKRYFGRIENERLSYRKSNLNRIGAFDQSFLQARSFGYEFGASYRFSPSPKHTLTLGAYYRNEQDLDMNAANSRVFFGSFGNISSYDTLIPFENRSGSITLPEKLSGGLTYEFKASKDSISRSGRLPSIMLTGEYSMEDWTTYRENFGEVISSPDLFESFSARFGFQYTPHRIITDRSTYIKGFQKWSYRFGAYYIATPYQGLGGYQVFDQGVTAGIGIPIVLSRAVSSVHVSVNYGQRGAVEGVSPIRENYVGVNFGLNIAPSYDRWFTKYQLD